MKALVASRSEEFRNRVAEMLRLGNQDVKDTDRASHLISKYP